MKNHFCIIETKMIFHLIDYYRVKIMFFVLFLLYLQVSCLTHNGNVPNKNISVIQIYCDGNDYNRFLHVQKFMMEKLCIDFVTIEYDNKNSSSLIDAIRNERIKPLNVTCTDRLKEEYRGMLLTRQLLSYMGFSADDDKESVMIAMKKDPESMFAKDAVPSIGLLLSDRDVQSIGKVYPICNEIINKVKERDDTGLILIFVGVGLLSLAIVGGMVWHGVTFYRRMLNSKIIISKTDDKNTEMRLQF